MFEKTFCSSPWFHLRLTYDGYYETCRWGKNSKTTYNIKDTSILEFYNSDVCKNLRNDLLAGKKLDHCSSCHYEENFGKLNGRKRQLLKSAIDTNNFALTMRSSPHYNNFLYSHDHEGSANLVPSDLQIDLGNFCNSACIMCTPDASSRLASDYKKLSIQNKNLFQFQPIKNWTNDEKLVDKFTNEIRNLNNIKYIHFLGGETLYIPAFYQICDSLIENKNLIVGTTTNGTIFNDKIVKYIESFKQFHLGISIDSVTNLNDYVRYPGKIDEILSNIKKFLNLRSTYPGLQISLRITPNIFTIYNLDKLCIFMLENNVIAESCNILYNPEFLKIELLPKNLRQHVIHKFEQLISLYNLQKTEIINVRRNDLIKDVIANVILEYYDFLTTYKEIENPDKSRYQLVEFIKSFESLRKNSILDHLPEYEEFLRSYGY